MHMYTYIDIYSHIYMHRFFNVHTYMNVYVGPSYLASQVWTPASVSSLPAMGGPASPTQ